MNSIYRIFLFLFTLLLIIKCEDSAVLKKHFKIPEEGRCIFIPGDTLMYRCSDGSFDTVLVKEVKFWTEDGLSDDWLGIKTNYSMDKCQITVEHFNDNWNNFLVGAEAVHDVVIVYNRCFTILGSARSDLDYPTTDVSNSCTG